MESDFDKEIKKLQEQNKKKNKLDFYIFTLYISTLEKYNIRVLKNKSYEKTLQKQFNDNLLNVH